MMVEELARESDWLVMLLRLNYNTEISDLNTAALEKAIEKEIQCRWAMPHTIYSIHIVKDVESVMIEVADQF